MARLKWNEVGKRFYEIGVDQGVFYKQDESGKYPTGVAWDGLTTVTQSPSGAEPTPLYASNIKYLNLMSNEEFGCTIEAYSSPEEFDECDGSAEVAKGVKIGQQTRKTFGFCYRTKIGNDTESTDLGYKIHCVYGCLASPSEKAYNTINESPEAMTLSWEVTTTPVDVTNFKPTAHLEIDSRNVDPGKLKQLEDKLYGSEEGEATLPLPDEIIALLGE